MPGKGFGYGWGLTRRQRALAGASGVAIVTDGGDYIITDGGDWIITD
jgi:hypothetical protein